MKYMKKHIFEHFIENKLTGVTSIGERGQIVIPAEIRKELKLKKGEKLFVFARNNRFIGLIKIDEMSNFLRKVLAKIEGDNE